MEAKICFNCTCKSIHGHKRLFCDETKCQQVLDYKSGMQEVVGWQAFLEEHGLEVR